MSVIIKGMQLPDKCCKCPIYRKHIGTCPVAVRHVSDPSKKPDFCPLEVSE